jgi:hypothetical protein
MEMAAEELRATLRDEGVVVLRGLFAPERLTRVREAAGHCFEGIGRLKPIPARYRFIPQVQSLLLTALLDFGIESEEALLAPLSAAGLGELFADLVGARWRCRLEHSWARKKFAPRNAPASGYALQDWHQDGALGVEFPPRPGPAIAATKLATCWIPLDACGRESPGLEFIREPMPGLLHFTELDDTALRERMGGAAFWAPELEFGDGLVFRNDILHRTYVHPEMVADRMSVEYRIFPEGA